MDPKHSQLDNDTNKSKKTPTRRTLTPAAKAAQVEASRKYRWKRRQILKEPGEKSDAYVEGVKNAQQRYRTKNSKYLAFKQRLRRQEAYIAKYGADAYHERSQRQQARAEAAWALQAAGACNNHF
ncbi:hypothetical protein R3P38DRAFT_2763055 [Favolaschia claudopus]|uniref:Uncharacterized protein n=1 Tax=Favolaschia claudopus TaxID=2862362 RepID=A0AAW0DNM5_9AGAR